MNIQYVTLEGVKIGVNEFLDNQKVFLIDAKILCGGLHNILIRDKLYAENLVKNLNILYDKILERHQIILNLSDTIVGQNEASIGMGDLLYDIRDMQEMCTNQLSEVEH